MEQLIFGAVRKLLKFFVQEQILGENGHLMASCLWNIFTKNYYKKAQLSLGKKCYSLFSSCCSTDLQGHPRSMICMPYKNQHATFY